MREPIRVLVVLEHADESSIPLEVAAGVESAADDIEQVVCAFRPLEGPTFGVDVLSLGGESRLDPQPYRRLDALVRTADVVHVHPIGVGAVVRVMAAARGVPVVKTEHNTHSDYGPVKNLVNGTTNALSDVVVSVSETIDGDMPDWERALLRAAGVRATVIHNGIDVDAVRAAGSRPVPIDLPDGLLVGAGGRLVPQKNLGTLVDAVALIADDHPEVHVVVTGDGPRREPLQRHARERGVDDRFLFTGFLPERTDVHAVFTRLDLYAMPSRHEGFGLAALEAMAAGLPVVASDIPALREVVGGAGVFVDPNDHTALADALARLAADRPDRAALAETARGRAASFPIEGTVAAYSALYRDLAD